MDEGRSRAFAAFGDRFGSQPELLIRSPGRVNLIGDHTDYNDGFVLPIAMDLAIWIALRPTNGDTALVWTELGDRWGEVSLRHPSPAAGWIAYLAGVAGEMAALGVALRGWEGVIVSDIPSGAGLSSSAALELAFAMAFSEVSGAGWLPVEIALLCRRAENDWVGVQCGIMDQLICATGSPGHALLIDCRDLTTRAARIPDDAAVVVLDTGTRRELAGSEYNERRDRCRLAASLLGVSSLRDVDADELRGSGGALDDVTYRVVRHVVTENARTVEAARLLDAGDLEGAGALMVASHASLRDDYEVSSQALDAMVEAATASTGCHGARMTGAGFAGSCVALVASSEVPEFAGLVAARYHEATGLMATVMPISAAAGTSIEPMPF